MFHEKSALILVIVCIAIVLYMIPLNSILVPKAQLFGNSAQETYPQLVKKSTYSEERRAFSNSLPEMLESGPNYHRELNKRAANGGPLTSSSYTDSDSFDINKIENLLNYSANKVYQDRLPIKFPKGNIDISVADFHNPVFEALHN